MRRMNSGSVDLIYLDPPFNSKRDYAAPIGSEAAGAEFKDTWNLDDIDDEWIESIAKEHLKLYRVLLASMTDSNKSYLAYMSPRIIEMHRILKVTGSIYLHCDPTMSHHLKLVMDAIFGVENFRNEIIWGYRKMPNNAKSFQKNHDVILFYTKTNKYTFNTQYGEMSESSRRTFENAARVGYNANLKKKMVTVFDWDKYRMAIEDGTLPDDLSPVEFKGGNPPLASWWSDITILSPNSKERTGFRTQKPLALLDRIIDASSNEGDIVFDPFCGCATALVASEMRPKRRHWIGIDISPKAAELVVGRIKKAQKMFKDIIPRDDLPQRTDIGKLPSPRNWVDHLYGRQGGNCNGCGIHQTNKGNLEVDHIISLKKGGTDHIDNLQLLCSNCNRIKGSRSMEYLTNMRRKTKELLEIM